MRDYRREYSSRFLTLRSGASIVRADLVQAVAFDSLSPPLSPSRAAGDAPRPAPARRRAALSVRSAGQDPVDRHRERLAPACVPIRESRRWDPRETGWTRDVNRPGPRARPVHHTGVRRGGASGSRGARVELHHAAHATHATHATAHCRSSSSGGGGIGLFGLVRHQGLGGEQQPGDGRRVLQG